MIQCGACREWFHTVSCVKIDESFTSYFIFILVSLIFYPGLALTVARGEMPYVRTQYAR